jgi:hypothetical protein
VREARFLVADDRAKERGNDRAQRDRPSRHCPGNLGNSCLSAPRFSRSSWHHSRRSLPQRALVLGISGQEQPERSRSVRSNLRPTSGVASIWD